jgi:hypothetical protein
MMDRRPGNAPVTTDREHHGEPCCNASALCIQYNAFNIANDGQDNYLAVHLGEIAI